MPPSTMAATATTAGIAPEKLPSYLNRTLSRPVVISLLVIFIAAGFFLRASGLSAEGLSEDELNKWEAVADYRARGLTPSNGEHPMLMKALQTVSVVATERWNAGALAESNSNLRISPETGLRLPSIVFGALTGLLIFLVAAELFGTETGLLAAALWSIDPTAIGLNRIAKEDTFFVFFFLLANFFWLRGQSAAETLRGRFDVYLWLTAAALGAMVAAKYYAFMIAVSACYYYIFQGIDRTRWRIGKLRWLMIFVIMGVTFLLCNLTILLPGTWREMIIFATERRIGHDSYEFMGALYPNQMTYWLHGVPWTFYYVFALVKTPLPVLLAFLVGLPLLFRKRIGDGRFFLLFWFMFFLPFTVLGGKFTRYYTIILPAVIIVAAIGAQWIIKWLERFASNVFSSSSVTANLYMRVTVILLLLSSSAYASVRWMPHYRLYTNVFGGGEQQAGAIFPHDDFYDASMRDAANELAQRAAPQARVASESPRVFTHYARLAGRNDLVSVSLSDREAVRQLKAGDFVIVARGRRYFSNDRIIEQLQAVSRPATNIMLGRVPAIQIFTLDESSIAAINEERAR